MIYLNQIEELFLLENALLLKLIRLYSYYGQKKNIPLVLVKLEIKKEIIKNISIYFLRILNIIQIFQNHQFAKNVVNLIIMIQKEIFLSKVKK